LLASHPGTLSAITVAGAVYLLWLGFNMVLRPPVPQASSSDQNDSWAHWAVKGLCISGLNPKLFLLFLALMPQFTDPHGVWSEPLQILALGAVHIVSCATVYLLVGFSAQTVLKTRPVAARFVSRFSGVAMIIIAAVLFLEQAKP
jgi:threonine/homoserine/homoserine lactone efflux protein